MIEKLKARLTELASQEEQLVASLNATVGAKNEILRLIAELEKEGEG
jgi:hypothetical protein